jgi:hypothetical protein
MTLVARIALACLLPMLLGGCLLVPGKFNSSLTIHADRSFAFAYKGQLIASDPSESMSPSDSGTPDSSPEAKAEAAAKAKEKATKAREREEKNRAIAAALSKEWGYRSVVYKGNGVFDVDYAVNGVLTTNFTFPFNSDAEVMMPFVAIEVRKDGTVRLRAPGFGKASGSGGGASLPMAQDPSDLAEGVFTLVTDAEIIAQNQEDGAKSSANGKTIIWTIGKIKRDAPTAVLRMRN